MCWSMLDAWADILCGSLKRKVGIWLTIKLDSKFVFCSIHSLQCSSSFLNEWRKKNGNCKRMLYFFILEILYSCQAKSNSMQIDVNFYGKIIFILIESITACVRITSKSVPECCSWCLQEFIRHLVFVRQPI